MIIRKSTFLGMCLVLQSAVAAMPTGIPIECQGEGLFKGVFIDFACINGNCTGEIPEQLVQFIGKCTADIDYVAEGKVAPELVSGKCRGGVISSNSYAQNVILYGDCTYQDFYYGTYYSSIYSPASSASGSCLENGTSRIYFDGGNRSIHGKCRQN
jgi:hypothetical protein